MVFKNSKNHSNCVIINECIYSETGKKLDFFTSDYGELSTLEQFRKSGSSSMLETLSYVILKL